MKIKDVINAIEAFAPLQYQESYDNAGLLFGNPQWEVTNALLTLDATEAVIDEAVARNCNLVVAHHPIVFGGLKKDQWQQLCGTGSHKGHQTRYCGICGPYQPG